MVFPRFFAKYRPKVTGILSRYGHHTSRELQSDVTPIEISLPGDYMELKDQGHNAGGQVPYAGGVSSFITNSTTRSDSHEPQSYDSTGSGEERSRIWKTVHVSQSARHVQ